MRSFAASFRVSLLCSALGILGFASSCSVLRTIESAVPEIPGLRLIGGNDGTTEIDPATLRPSLTEDVAIFSIDYLGEQRRIVIRLFPQDAPITVANFQQQIRNDYYEGLAIHRVIPNYLVQMGDPQTKDPATRATWGTGDPSHQLPAEIKRPHVFGSVGMARLPDQRNPNRESSGGQFYITVGDLKQFDGKYTVFGQVIQGYEFLQRIAEAPADENDNPYPRIEIKSTELGNSAHYAPEDVNKLRRKMRRRSMEEIPAETTGRLGRLMDRIW